MLSALLTVLSFFVIYLLIGVIVFGFLYVYSDTGSEWDITNIDCDEQILVWILWVVFLIIFLFQRIGKQRALDIVIILKGNSVMKFR